MLLARHNHTLMRFLSNSSRGSRRSNSSGSWSSAVTVHFGLGAVARDMTGLTAAVASLSSRVERATVRGRAVAGDVTQLAAGVALHGLGLAIARKVVRSTALVAGGGATATVAAPEAAISSTGSASAPSHTSTRVGAVTGQVAR